MKEKMRQPKDIGKQIRLIMNQIAPDTFDKKEEQIKKLMFKAAEEVKAEEAEAQGTTPKDGEEVKVSSLTLDEENLSQIVQTLFRKA